MTTPGRRSATQAPGPLRQAWKQTPAILWVAVALLSAGFRLAGTALIARRTSNTLALGFGLASAALLVVGVVLARRHHMMRDVA